jgi:type IX secretion system PorP/SprF family membrane protein
MKRALLCLSFICLWLFSKAQQDPHYTQFFLNRLNYNPAFAGTEEKICALGVFRSQWVGFGGNDAGNAPTTFMASINSPLGKHFGVGLNVMNDQLGFQNSINPILSLSYRKVFQNASMISVGVSGGIMQQSLQGSKLKPLQDNDPKIPNTDVTGMSTDFNAGIYYTMPNLWRFQNFYTGISATHLNQGNVQYSWGDNQVDNQMKLHYYLMTGAQYEITPGTLVAEPNLFFKYDGANLSFDLNVMAEYNGKIRGGLTYRAGDAVSILAGYKFTPVMQIGYSYDLTTSDIISYSTGTHEILFKYCFMPKFKEKIPPPPIPRLTPRFL